MITQFAYTRLRHDELYTFTRNVIQIVESTCGACGKVFETFKESADRLDFMIQDKASKETLGLEVLDYAADEAWVGLSLQVQASLKHPNPDVRSAAAVVDEVFSKTPNPTRLRYELEYSMLADLLEQLRQIDTETLRRAFVDVYINYLSDCVDRFVATSQTVDDIKSKQAAGELKEATEECFKNWLFLAKYLEAMHAAGALKNGDDCINRLNEMCLRAKERLALRVQNSQMDEFNVFDEEM